MIKYTLATTFGLGMGWVIARYCRNNKSKIENCTNEVLFFPDSQFPCGNITDLLRLDRISQSCYNPSCRKLHGREGEPESSFIKFLLHIAGAKHSVDLCIFMFTQQTLANLLSELHRSGVRVRIITDAAEDDGMSSQIDNLCKTGIEIKSNKRKTGALMHHKFVIIDNQLLISGSFNWTNKAVVNNFEAVMVTSNQSLVRPFIEEFDKMWSLFMPHKQKPQTKYVQALYDNTRMFNTY